LNGRNFTNDEVARLAKMQKRLGLADDHAFKIINKLNSKKKKEMFDSLTQTQMQDTITFKSLLELSNSNVELVESVPKKLRLQVYRDEVEKRMTDGKGGFNKDEFLIEYSKALGLDSSEVSITVENIAKCKLRPTLVQAISFYRQNKGSEVAKTMQNYISQFRAFPESIHWDCEEDIMGVYIHCIRQLESKALVQEIAVALKLTQSALKAAERSAEAETEKYSEDVSYFG